MRREENELICRVGPGTPMGAVFRRYWTPIADAKQLADNDGDPLRVRYCGEDYVAFRDSDGKLGLLDELCPHRGTSLALGRNEEGGLRCIYHGWKFAADGALLDAPNHPDPNFCAHFKANSYPVREAGGLIWGYFGPEDKQRFRLEIAVPPGPVSKQDVLALRRVYRQLQEIPLAAAIHQVCEERRIVVGSACRAKADWLRQLFQRRGVAVSIVPDDNAA